MFDAIAFDADDTLWHTERYYRQAEAGFLALLERYSVSRERALEILHRIEIDNLPYFGYGIRGFVLSMIEAAVQATDGQVHGADIAGMVEIGRGMTSHPIEPLPGVLDALDSLRHRRLLLITKGDTLDQESKIQRSGLAEYFPVIEVVIDKTPSVYAALLEKHNLSPQRFLMVGNSLRSDIAPVLAVGGYAVHVPYAIGWAHESVADLPADRSRFFEIPSLQELPALIAQIEAGPTH